MNRLLVVCGACVSLVCETLAKEDWTQRVYEYLQKLDGIEADFVQSNAGNSTNGKVWLKRPNIKFCIGHLTVVAQKNKIVQYDSLRKERSEMGKNPYAAFLKKNIRQIFQIQHVEKSPAGNSLAVSGCLKDIPGKIVISFDINSRGDITINGWRITYNNGQKCVAIKIKKISPITCSENELLDYSKSH